MKPFYKEPPVQNGNFESKPASTYRTLPAEMVRDRREEAILQLQIRIAELRKEGAFVGGDAGGANPRFFLVADAASQMDIACNKPFSGPMQHVYIRTVETLRLQYGVTPEDIYRTYMVKTVQNVWPTDAELERLWLPIVQLEFYLSGCDTVVAVGAKARRYAGLIAAVPPGLEKSIPIDALEQNKNIPIRKLITNILGALWHVLIERVKLKRNDSK